MNDSRPLAEKLRHADGGHLTLALARQTAENYFAAFSSMLGDSRFTDTYKNLVAANPELDQASLSRLLFQLPRDENRPEWLYQILIEPFLAIQTNDEEEEETNDTYDY